MPIWTDLLVKRSPGATAFADATLNHLELYVGNAIARAAELTECYGFEPIATSGSLGGESEFFSIALRQGSIALVLTEPRAGGHPGQAFLAAHGDGVVDIALRVNDARAAFEQSIQRGAQPVSAPGGGAPSAIRAFGDVRHSFVQPPAGTGGALFLPGFPTIDASAGQGGTGLELVDHVAVCLPAGDLVQVVALYESALDLRVVFEERIVVGTQAMLSQVVQNTSRTLTLTLIQPDPAADPGQIDDFLGKNCGAGVQHIAFSTPDVVRTVAALAERGVEFLQTPAAYYPMQEQRLTLAKHSTQDLRELNILVDQDQDGQLFQIFARSTHPRRTLFFEVIERLGARTFGSGNIRALYKAVEADRSATQVNA